MAKRTPLKIQPILKIDEVTMNDKFQWSVFWGMKILISVIIVLIAYRFANQIAKIVIKEVQRHGSQQKKLIIRQLSEFIFYVIMALGLFIALINMGVQTSTIITLLGTLMVTIGFAMQSTLSNIFSGVFVALAENFQIGDIIRLYVPFIGHAIEGKVIDFNISYLKLEDVRTHSITYIPNTAVSGNVLVNLSRQSVE